MWVPGSIALVTALSLAVLVQTGWFQGLDRDLTASRRIAGLFLLLQGSLTFVYVSVGGWEVHIGTLLWLILFPFLWRGVQREVAVTLLAALMMTGSVLLFLQEWFWLKPSTWWDAPGTWLAVTLPAATVIASRLSERLLVGTGGVMLSELLRLLIHRKELSPIVLGETDWLDRFWLVVTGIFLFHYALRWMSDRMGNPDPTSDYPGE